MGGRWRKPGCSHDPPPLPSPRTAREAARNPACDGGRLGGVAAAAAVCRLRGGGGGVVRASTERPGGVCGAQGSRMNASSLHILRLLVAETFAPVAPCGMTAEELAAKVYPLPALPSVWAPGQRRAVLGAPAIPERPATAFRRAIPAQEAVVGSREVLARANVARVSAQLGELVRRGYVERIRPPVVAAWFRRSVERRGSLRAALFRLEWPEETASATVDAWATMVTAAEESPGVWRPGKTGAQQESYRALCGFGVFEAPAMRWATEKGRQLVEEQR